MTTHCKGKKKSCIVAVRGWEERGEREGENVISTNTDVSSSVLLYQVHSVAIVRNIARSVSNECHYLIPSEPLDTYRVAMVTRTGCGHHTYVPVTQVDYKLDTQVPSLLMNNVRLSVLY